MGIIIDRLLDGLRKSFDGKDHLRDIHVCKTCGNPAYIDSICSYCRTCIDYELSKYQHRKKDAFTGRANTEPFDKPDWWKHGEKGAT